MAAVPPTPGKSAVTPARGGQTPKAASACGCACPFQIAALIALIASLVVLYVKGNLGKKNASIAVGAYAAVAALIFVIGKFRGQKSCAVKGKAD
jgi:hypothetical protein